MDPALETKYKSLMSRIEKKPVALSPEEALSAEVEAPAATSSVSKVD